MTEPADPERRPLLLLDTHVLVWMVFGEPMLGPRARMAIDKAMPKDALLISAITPWEIGMLASKKRLTLYRDVLEWVRDALALPGIQLAPLSPEISVGSNHLPFGMHPDPADRILVATARHLGATLVTADQPLLNLGKKGHFKALNAAK